MIKYLVFDLDGVLLNTERGIIESSRYAAETQGYSDLNYEEWKTFVGPPIQESFIRYFNCSKKEAQIAAEVFRDHYMNVTLFNAEPYDGIYDVLDNLKESFTMSVATYKREDYAITLLKHFCFDKYFYSIHGADHYNKLSKANIIEQCLTEMDAHPKEAVLIGDTYHDALGAGKAGVGFLAVTYGFGYKDSKSVKQSTIGIANKPTEIAEILKGVNMMDKTQIVATGETVQKRF